MYKIENFHLIEIKYHSRSDGGSRVKLSSYRFNDYIFIDYNHEFRDSLEIGINFLESKGITIRGKGETKNAYFIITDKFLPLKEIKLITNKQG